MRVLSIAELEQVSGAGHKSCRPKPKKCKSGKGTKSGKSRKCRSKSKSRSKSRSRC